MDNDKIKICFLYSRSMNIYGDRGNVIILQKRAEWRGKKVEVVYYNVGDDNFDFSSVDLFFFGGGQDQQQMVVANDLYKIKDCLIDQIVDKKAVMLSICGGMQLLGNYYEMVNGDRIKGVGLFDLYTVGGEERYIGNVMAKSRITGEENILVGFENHSGRTYVNWKKNKPLGEVVYGRGNNAEDGTEGVVCECGVGSYLHGCILSKNPWLADWLLKKAFGRKYGVYQLSELDDSWEITAQKKAVKLAEKSSRVTNITGKE